jgi:beta-lactamase regulating signal transducer with metallopeptidase domain
MSWNVDTLHLFARLSVERMVYSLVEGTVLVLVVGLLLRFLPRRNSGTRFVIWFSTLISLLLLPLIGHSFIRNSWSSTAGAGTTPTPAALITIPSSWTLYLFFAWMAIAAISLARVAAGLWQVRSLRRNCVEIGPERLLPELREILEGCRDSRPVALCVSQEIQVPTAIGFLHPAVVLPAWLMDDLPPAEIQQVVLHELTHLRRRDDWTNLAQKLIKAFLFFHPSVWWVEQRLSLEREMACDDAVLAQTASAREYAVCLTRMAEKSFMRRQLAMAQAAVDRMRQLSLRVAQILDRNRPGSTRLWKPAVPLVATAAMVCVFSAGHAPELVSFSGNPAPISASAATLHPAASAPVVVKSALAAPVHAAARPALASPHMILASAREPLAAEQNRHTGKAAAAMFHRVPKRNQARPVLARAVEPTPVPAGDYVVQQQAVFLTVTTSGQAVWQVRTWELRFRLPASPDVRNQIPRKST